MTEEKKDYSLEELYVVPIYDDEVAAELPYDKIRPLWLKSPPNKEAETGIRAPAMLYRHVTGALYGLWSDSKFTWWSAHNSGLVFSTLRYYLAEAQWLVAIDRPYKDQPIPDWRIARLDNWEGRTWLEK